MNFEDYLRKIHAKQYKGLDDDMPDDFDYWLTQLDPDELIEYANQALLEKNHQS